MEQPTLIVDLFSDTATRPCQAMRQAMAQAPVGDEQLDEDPTVNALNQKVAQLLGKEAAIFLPSGTMANQIALAVHCRSGDAILAAQNAHIIGSEGAGAAVFAGAVIHGIPTPDGIFDADDLARHCRPARIKAPRPRVVEVEQTSNRGGGSVWPLDVLAGVSAFAEANGLIVHMDGARLLNAVVATGVPASEYAALCDTVWIDLSKGLGCPIGSVLAGSRQFIEDATVWKHRFGGAMRQAGIVAAAGLYALEHNVQALDEDHRRTRVFAEFLAELPGIKLLHGSVQTNLVFFDVTGSNRSALDIARELRSRGIRIGAESAQVMRAVFHRDVDDTGLQMAMDALRSVLRD